MKKILIILGSYFPKPSANGICVKQVVDEFKKQKVDVTILATKSRGLNEIDTVDDINVYRVKPRWSQRMIEWCDDNKDKKYAGAIRRIVSIINKIKHALFFPTWPLVSPIYAYRYYKKTKELCKTNKYDGIVSVYTPIDSLIAGALIKRKSSDTKLMLYFLDTLSGGVAPKGFSREWLENRGYRWDEKLFNIADDIFVMKSHEQHYSKEIYNKFKNKLKILDIPLMREMKQSINIDNQIYSKEKVNIVYTGSLLKHVRNPSYMLVIFGKIINGFNLHIYGGGDCSDLLDNYISQNEGTKIIKHGFVNYEMANNAIIQSDILINIGNIYGNLIPSKLFEYMATGKPIISFYRYDTEPSIPYLKKYPLSLLIKEDWDKIDENTQLIVNFINKYKGKFVDYNEIKDIFQENTPEPLVKYVLDLIEE